jgi:glycosyltransferase involved in cell wall biosynthesis
MSQEAHPIPTVMYVINSFDRGGAEAGLVTLVKGGLFQHFRLLIVSLVRGVGGLELTLIGLGYPPHIIDDRPRMRTKDLPRIFFRLRQFLRRENPDIVIASLPQANILSRLCLLFQRRTIFVSFEHNTHLAKRAYEVAFRLTSARVDCMFADAKGTLNVAAERLYRTVPQKRIVVPLLCFASQAKYPRDTEQGKPFHIINAARFTAAKNQSALIEALAILIREQCNVTLTLFGEGPERQACQELAARLGVAQQVRFPGFVEHWSSMPADLFVLVSRHEGLCIVVLEAMHAGIPVAASVVGGMADYADRTVLHPLESIEPVAIARTIAELMHDGPGLVDQVARALEMINRRFGSAAVRRVYEEVSQSLLAEVRMRVGELTSH